MYLSWHMTRTYFFVVPKQDIVAIVTNVNDHAVTIRNGWAHDLEVVAKAETDV